MNNYKNIDRLLNVIDEIDGNPSRTTIRKNALRRLISNNGRDSTSPLGESLLEELYIAIYYE